LARSSPVISQLANIVPSRVPIHISSPAIWACGMYIF
jgi:hypothetical protein